MQEEWKPILDYPDYEVSNLGNVRRFGKIKKPGKNQCGYYQISLCKNNDKKNKRIHRLVALAFLPNPENKGYVDHIDRNRTNNVVTNLRWVTHSENMLNNVRRNKDLFGISYHKRDRKYQVHITINQKQTYIGYRSTLEEAIILRDNTFATLRNTSLSSELQ